MSEIIERLTPLLRGQRVERQAARRAQLADAAGDALVGRRTPYPP